MSITIKTNVVGLKGADKVAAVRKNLIARKFKYKMRLNLEKSSIRITIGTTYGKGSYGNPMYMFQTWNEAIKGLELIKYIHGGETIKSKTTHFTGKVIGVRFDKSVLNRIKFNDELRRFWIE